MTEQAAPTVTAEQLEAEAVMLMQKHMVLFEAWSKCYLAEVEEFSNRVNKADISPTFKIAIGTKMMDMANQLAEAQ